MQFLELGPGVGFRGQGRGEKLIYKEYDERIILYTFIVPFCISLLP